MVTPSALACSSPDILYAICCAVYSAALPPSPPSLDPLLSPPSETAFPTGLPSSYPAPNWPEHISRKTLLSLCQVNKAWQDAAMPWLYRRIEVRLPRSWLSFVDQVLGGEDDEDAETTASLVHETVRHAAVALANGGDALSVQECMMESLSAGLPEERIPPELLSPPASRDPSPQRLRAKSPGRWRLLRSISDAVEHATGMYVPTPQDHRPGRHTRSLDFNHFRTIGMRRSVGEGMNSRFVTGERVERVLQEMPNLQAFGATEYMDGALTLPVLSGLLLRGRRDRGRARPRNSFEDDAAERRKEYRPLDALDFCGCVSSVFVRALGEFVRTYLLSEDGEWTEFPELRRLGLRSVRSIPESVLTPFVLSFPFLTHLDLSGTLCSPELLEELSKQPYMRLTSLALARCGRLTSESITQLLVEGSITFGLKELSLYGDEMFGTNLTEEDLLRIVKNAPSFLSGGFRYLDLSSCPVTPEVLKVFPAQPALRSLGLAHIPLLELSDIADFIVAKCPNVEVLTLVKTSPELSQANIMSQRVATLPLHSKIIHPLATPPFSFSLTGPAPAKPAATRLRVIELSPFMLNALGAGAGAWRVIRSKGGRGWYVDTACGWVADGEHGAVLQRDLPIDHPFRVEMVKLADANGNVNSGVGWHSRKMEIVHGDGMFGREDGLYGAVSFAYHG